MERIKDQFKLQLTSRQSSGDNTSKSHRKTVRFIVKDNTPEVGSPVPKNINQSDVSFSDSDEDQKILKDLAYATHKQPKQISKGSIFQMNKNHIAQNLPMQKSSSQIFKLGENNLHKKQSMKDQIRQSLKNVDNRENAHFDPSDDFKNYLLDQDSVKNLDTFEMKVAPTALHIFAENLNGRLKNMAFSQNNQSTVPFSKQLKILSDTKSTQASSMSRPHTSRISINRENTQAGLNMNNLNKIMKDNQKTAIEQMFENKENQGKFEIQHKAMQKQVKEIEKYVSMQKGDLYSEEARRQVTKYKIYRPRTAISEKREELIQKVKTTSALANEKQFQVRIQKEMPSNLNSDEVVATQMDLYIPLNLNQNIQKARLQRQKDRMMEQLSSKLTKIEGFVDETFKAKSLNERIRVETELLNEYKSLQHKIEELRKQRTSIFALNTNLHNQLQQMKQNNKMQDEEIKRMQLSSRTTFESKMKNMDKNNMIRDLIKISSEKEHLDRMKDERKKRDNAIHKQRDKNNERIYYVDQEIEVIKQQLQFILNVQKEYYLRLLRDGQDTRQKGLVWIIQCLQCELEVPVIFKDQMPNILDERSKQFLMDLAIRDYKLVVQQRNMAELKIQQKQELISDSRKTLARGEINSQRESQRSLNAQGFYFTEKGFQPIRTGDKFQEIMDLKNATIKQIQTNRNEQQRGVSAKPSKTITQIVNESNAMHSKIFGFETLFTKNTKKLLLNKLMGQASKALSARSGLMSQNGMYLTKGEQLQKQIDEKQACIDKLEQEINEYKMAEIRRLARDYLNHYSELRKCLKSSVDLKKLFQCLFGDSSWEVEFNKQLKKQQQYKHQNPVIEEAIVNNKNL